jgi:transcriptional regulator with XRE-family HTH domain
MATARAVHFDSPALYAALDAQRQAQGLTWQEVARQIRVSASTLAGVKRAAVLEGDGVLGMVRWLGCSPERFTLGAGEASTGPMAIASAVGRGQYLRFDTRAMHAALDARRRARGLTWREAAEEIGVGASSLTHLAKGGRTGFPHVMRMAAWLDRTAESFTHVTNW